MRKNQRIIKIITAILVAAFTVNPISDTTAWADDSAMGFSVSPLTEHIVLEPGESYSNTIKVFNSTTHKTSINYAVEVQPFYVDENYKTVFENIDDRSLMANWITIDSPETGNLAPGETNEIIFTINVPTNAPAGGQYADVRVISTNDDQSEKNDSSAVGEQIAIGHLIFAEITGNTIRQGEIIDASVPSFLLSGNINGSAIVKNTGNIHAVATYKLQIYPLFSNEEIYSNEENPDEKTILPDRTLYNELSWDQTPDIGIFNVIYTVEFEGVTTQVSKMVIKCPIWLLFIIFFVIAALIIWIIMRVRHHGKAKSHKNAKTETE